MPDAGGVQAAIKESLFTFRAHVGTGGLPLGRRAPPGVPEISRFMRWCERTTAD